MLLSYKKGSPPERCHNMNDSQKTLQKKPDTKVIQGMI